jgi:hypothetical protein
MGEITERTWDPTTVDLIKATDEELNRLKRMPDEDLLRCSRSLDLFAVVESNRRLKDALHKEEKAIKWLTVVLIVLTVILVFLGLEALRR